MSRIRLAIVAVLIFCAPPSAARDYPFPYPRTLECNVDSNGTSDCPEAEDIPEGQSLLCTTDRRGPNTCKIVSREACELVSTEPGPICAVDPLDVRARQTARLIITTLQAVEAEASGPNSFAHAAVVLSDPEVRAMAKEFQSMVIAAAQLPEGQCTPEISTLVGDIVAPVEDRSLTWLDTMAEETRERVIGACIRAEICTLDALSRSSDDLAQAFTTTAGALICRESVQLLREEPETPPVYRADPRKIRVVLKELAKPEAERDWLAAFNAALDIPEVTNLDGTLVRMMWAREVFQSIGINPVTFFRRELLRQPSRPVSRREAGQLLGLLKASQPGAEGAIHFRDPFNEFCGPLSYKTSAWPPGDLLSERGKSVHSLMEGDVLVLLIGRVGNVTVKHVVEHLSYVFTEDSMLSPYWDGTTFVCRGTPERHGACEEIDRPFAFALQYDSDAFLRSLFDYGPECGG